MGIGLCEFESHLPHKIGADLNQRLFCAISRSLTEGRSPLRPPRSLRSETVSPISISIKKGSELSDPFCIFKKNTRDLLGDADCNAILLGNARYLLGIAKELCSNAIGSDTSISESLLYNIGALL